MLFVPASIGAGALGGAQQPILFCPLTTDMLHIVEPVGQQKPFVLLTSLVAYVHPWSQQPAAPELVFAVQYATFGLPVLRFSWSQHIGALRDMMLFFGTGFLPCAWSQQATYPVAASGQALVTPIAQQYGWPLVPVRQLLQQPGFRASLQNVAV